jgi:kynurenine formamidase
MRRIIDISVPLMSGIASDPPGSRPEIRYIGHGESAPDLLAAFPGASAADLPAGEGWAAEWISLSTHSGTHLDAPYHYSATMDGGKRAITIDEVPLDWCFQPAVKLDFRQLPDGYVATPDDIDAELERVGHTLRPLDIVVINTSAGERYGHDDYVSRGCGVGRDGTLHLLRQGVRLTGTDGWSWDAPFVHTAARYARDGDSSVIWEGHKAGREIGYCHLEKLHNLEALPADGFQIVCFPTKVHAGSAGWTRAVAIIDEPDSLTTT